MVDSAAADEAAGPRAASRANRPVEILSTDRAHARERFSYWREAVHIATAGFFGMPTQAPPGVFSARAALRSCGVFRFVMAESNTSYQIARTRREIAGDHYAIYLQLSGETVSIRGEEAVKLHAGDIGFCEGRPYRAEHGGRCAIAMVPRAMIERRAPWLRDGPHGKLASTARFADHLRLHMMELTAGRAPLGDTETRLLAESLCNLVALAAGHHIAPRRLQGELQLEALLAFCRENLHDPDLSPQQAADYVGISVRTLHSRFGQIGQTFGRWVLENRLEACSTALRDPRQKLLNISEVAYRWGFNDLSYFSKTFRTRFEMTPGEWRHDVKPS